MFKDIRDIREFKVSDGVSHVESKLYTGRKNDMNVLIKLLNFYSVKDDNDICLNKMYVINELYDNKNIIGIDELVMPIERARIYNDNIVCIYPYVPSYNFKDVINDNEVSVRDKINYLKQIGEILDKMDKVRKRGEISTFYLGDVHESNFIINKNTNRVNVVDMDSSKINFSCDNSSKYLYLCDSIYEVDKYKYREHFGVSVCMIDKNTDIFCYIMIILNYIFGIDMCSLDIKDYNICMEYLRDMGVSNNLVDILYRVYTNDDNINPYMLLDEFTYLKDKIDNNRSKLLRRVCYEGK